MNRKRRGNKTRPSIKRWTKYMKAVKKPRFK